MPFFKSVRRAPASECGEKRVFVTTKSGVKIWLDPYSETSSGPTCLDIPSGRGFMRKLMARYKCLEKNKKFVDITQVRGMVKYMSSVREQQGVRVAKAVRLLAAQLMNGFEVVALERGSCFDQLLALGIYLQINGREVVIRDLEGEFKFRDDYYFTGTKFALRDLLRKYKIPLTLVDQRDRNSVQKIVGGKSDVDLVGYFSSGAYLKNRITKLWGGLGLESVRKVLYRDVQPVGKRGIKIVKRKESKELNWKAAASRQDWVRVFGQILSHNFDKKKFEYLKAVMERSDFRKVRDRLRKLGAFDIIRPRQDLCEMIYDALSIEIGMKHDVWMSFVIRGVNNLLRYQGDRLEQMCCAHDEIMSITSSEGSNMEFYAPFKKK